MTGRQDEKGFATRQFPNCYIIKDILDGSAVIGHYLSKALTPCAKGEMTQKGVYVISRVFRE